MNLISGICPVCDASINLKSDVVETEVVSCSDCKSRLVIKNLKGKKASLSRAPEVEEDWGE